MSYWLVKSEPSCFSTDDLQKAPQQTTHWDGVRNLTYGIFPNLSCPDAHNLL